MTSGLSARYTNSSWTGLYWLDASGNGKHAAAGGSGHSRVCKAGNGAVNSVCAVQGSTLSSVTMPAGGVPSTFTMCSVSRYTGGSSGRIINGALNFIHGHWGGRAGVAHYNQWLTAYSTPVFITPTNWLVMCGQNAAPNLVTANGVSVATSASSAIMTQVGINAVGAYGGGGSVSDWAVLELSIWNRSLSAAEIKAVNGYYLGTVLGSGERCAAVPTV